MEWSKVLTRNGLIRYKTVFKLAHTDVFRLETYKARIRGRKLFIINELNPYSRNGT